MTTKKPSRRSPEEIQRAESEKIVAFHMAGLSIKLCLHLVVGTALARSAFTGDESLANIAEEIFALGCRIND